MLSKLNIEGEVSITSVAFSHGSTDYGYVKRVAITLVLSKVESDVVYSSYVLWEVP